MSRTYGAAGWVAPRVLDVVGRQFDGPAVERREELLGEGGFRHVGEVARVRAQGREGVGGVEGFGRGRRFRVVVTGHIMPARCGKGVVCKVR